MSRWGKCLCISLHVCNAVLGKFFDGATRNLPANLWIPSSGTLTPSEADGSSLSLLAHFFTHLYV